MILETVLHEFMLDMPQALAIWLTLIGVALAGFGSVVAVTKEPPRSPWGQRAQRRLRRATQAQELGRYADEVAVAASRASAMARRRYGEWVAVQRTQEAAWRAYESADEAFRRLHRAAAFPTPNEPLTAEELDDRQRYLARAATKAYARGELSTEQLSDALFHRNGWDPRKHPIEQQMTLRTIARERLLRAYLEASAIERGAWRAADMAASARRSLEDEAFAAATRALHAQSRATATVTPRRRLSGTVVARPSVAVS